MDKLVGDVTEVNRPVDRVLRIFAWVLPALAIGYGALILMGAVQGISVTIPWVYYTLSIVLVSMAIFQQTRPVTKRLGTASYLIIYHLCVAIGIFCVYGMNTPMMLLWGILSLITVIYFGFWICCISLASLAATFFVYKYSIGFLASWYSINLMTCFFFLGAIVIIYAYLQAETYRKQEKLVQARNDERLQRQALLTTINSTTQAMFTLSSKGTIMLYNSAFLALLDTNELPEHQAISKIMPLENEDGTPFNYTEILRSESRYSNDGLIYRVGSNDHLNIRLDINRVFDGDSQNDKRLQQFVCTARDITKEKSLEEERDEFISVVSHELRTPITVAEGALSNAKLVLDRDKEVDPSLALSVDMGHERILFLAKMVNDLSTLSRAERGLGDAKESIDIKDLAHQLYSEYEPQAKAKSLVFNLELASKLGTLTASHLYLEELLQNFITNAIKYTKKGSITLAIKRSADVVTFSVIDSGIGISKTDQQHVFERFYRSEDYRTRETGGTGLGLYVAMKLARKLGGEISLKSRLNHGSTFTLTLPVTTDKE